MSRGWERLEVHDRKRLECLEGSVARNVTVTGAFGEVSGGNEETGGEGPYDKAVEELAESCSVEWKAELQLMNLDI